MQKSYIQTFNECFWENTKINKNLLDTQKENLWFTLNVLNIANINNAIKIWINNSREMIDKHQSILSIPHTYIFGWLALWAILQFFNATFLFVPIFLVIWLIPVFLSSKIINDKIKLLLKLRVIYNMNIEESKKDFDYFFNQNDYKKTTLKKNTSNWTKNDIDTIWMKTFLFFFWQPFIFWHLHLFAWIPIFDLIIFDIYLAIIVFWIQEYLIIQWYNFLYKSMFYLIDKLPILFSKKYREYDFYYDFYNIISFTVKNLNILVWEIENYKQWIINKNIYVNVENTMKWIEKIMKLIKNNSIILQKESVFKEFLRNLVNEILEKYSEIFSYIENSINNSKTTTNFVEIKKLHSETINTQKNKIDNIKEELIRMKI